MICTCFLEALFQNVRFSIETRYWVTNLNLRWFKTAKLLLRHTTNVNNSNTVLKPILGRK